MVGQDQEQPEYANPEDFPDFDEIDSETIDDENGYDEAEDCSAEVEVDEEEEGEE